jgi:Bacterial regulatory proteins, luxR family
MAILFCGSWNQARQSDPWRSLSFVGLVLHRIDPRFGAVVGASGNSWVETVEAFLPLPKYPAVQAPIADKLEISEETVKSHMRKILSKLGANDRTHAVAIALKRGIIEI